MAWNPTLEEQGPEPAPDRERQRAKHRIDQWFGDEELLEALKSIPFSERQAILLRYVLDFSEHDVAQVIECSDAQARQLLTEALSRLTPLVPPGRIPLLPDSPS